MSDVTNRSRTSIGTSITIRPLDPGAGDIAGLLGNFLFDLLGMFYPRRVCSKVNVVVIELVTNVMEHSSVEESGIKVDVAIDPEQLCIRVSNGATREEFEAIKARLDEIASSTDPKHLLAKTVHARRPDRQKGGLGLIRLTAESKFQLSAEYGQGLLTIQAYFPMRGLA